MGFRPFVFRLARLHQLHGWVKNRPGGVLLEAQGEESGISAFLTALESEAPPLADITALKSEEISPCREDGFVILASSEEGGDAQISPDCDVCPDCLRELFDPSDRRFRYPFINCTNCGPRYSILTGVPYDRPRTTMAPFTMCPDCLAEYRDPAQRRFHAQPNACPACGPRLALTDRAGRALETGDSSPLQTAVELLRRGKILAIKGVGGYHLAVHALRDDSVGELRRRKKRDEKPFALMAPSLTAIRGFARLTGSEERLLSGPERPIVLVQKREDNPVSAQVAPANGYFGVMLPSTPLHHLLLRDNFAALVMTSGNLSDEPIAFRDDQALARLSRIADFFLTHDRAIHTRADDSVIRVFQGGPLFLRRSRGYVPRGVALPASQPSVLATGAELKSTVCLTRGDRAFLSQHIGDLKNAATFACLEETVQHLERVLEIRPAIVAHDLHPDYLSTSFAAAIPGLPKVAVQHHHAHMASCMAEHGLEGEVIGVILDGAGYGGDGTVWGGEFLQGGYTEFQRMAHLLPVPLPGGDAAAREPFRMALSWLRAVHGEKVFDLPLPLLAAIPEKERRIYLRMLERRINSPLTSSCGRLFDAVGAIIGLRNRVSYEGQAAIELEALAERATGQSPYPFSIVKGEAGALQLDLRAMVASIAEKALDGTDPCVIARAFHDTLAAAVAEVCELIRAASGTERVVLSGGVFQNRLLSEGVHSSLSRRGFRVLSQRLVPPNDGGIALGQAVIAGRTWKNYL